MSTPQDAPTRKKQKRNAARKLEEWRKKQPEQAPKAAKPTKAATK